MLLQKQLLEKLEKLVNKLNTGKQASKVVFLVFCSSVAILRIVLIGFIVDCFPPCFCGLCYVFCSIDLVVFSFCFVDQHFFRCF